MRKTEWTMETLDNLSAFKRDIASNTTIKHKNTITEEVLDKIRAEIQKLRNCSCSCSDGIIDDVEDILDKYSKGGDNDAEHQSE